MRHLIVVSLLLGLASPGAAQRTPSLMLAFDAGPSFPLGDFSDDGAEIGLGLGASATVRLTRLLGVYGSFERTSFGVEESEDNWTDTGFGAGVRVWVPVSPGARVHPWGQLGIGWHDVDAPIAGPEFAVVDTDGIRTIEGGAGFDVALGRRLLVRPALRYRKYSFELDTAGETLETNVSYLTVAVGLAVVLGRGPD